MKRYCYFILKYLGFIKTNYEVSKDVDFGSYETNEYFLNSLKKSKLYLEFGAGSSTLLADSLQINYRSIESDKNFYQFILNKIINKNKLFLINFGLTGDYSSPLFFKIRKYFFKNIAHRYSGQILNDLESEKKVPDLVLIDGRFRVLCALKLYSFLKNKTTYPTIILDDFKDREYYNVLENFFNIKLLGRFAILDNIKKNDNLKKFIKIYTNDPR